MNEEPQPTVGASTREARVQREQVAVLYRRLPFSLVASVLNGTLLALVLWEHLPRGQVVGWLGAVVGVALLRSLLLLAATRRGITADDAEAWGGVYAAFTALNGLAWGSAAFLLWVPANIALQLLLAVVLAGMVAGAAASNASRASAYLSFAIPTLVPVVVRLAIVGDHLRLVMGLFLTILAVFLLGIARAGSRAIQEAVRLRVENEDLLESLRRRSERRLARFRALLEQAGVGILVAEPDTHRIVDANAQAAAFLGMDLDDLQKCRLEEIGLVSQSSSAAWGALLTRIRGDGARTLEDRVGGDDGERWLETIVDVRPFGERDFALLVIRDVSDRKELEQGLTRASLLASVGTLAAGTAHEINNPLSYVMGNLEYVLMLMDRSGEAWPQEAKLREALGQALEGADQIRRVVRDLGHLAQKDVGEVGPVDLREVLEGCVSLAMNEIRHRARLTTSIPDLPPVLGERMQLTQVFLNLLVNAAQAIPAGAVDENRIAITATPADGFVRVEVSDTGEGMSEEITARAFEPFFTTRPVGSGMGLGLSVAHGIVTSLGGRMEAHSREGQGTVFEVHLPLAAEAQPEPRAPEAQAQAGSPHRQPASLQDAPAPPHGEPAPPHRETARVLVVDDDRAVAATVARTLQGHDVAVASSGREALDRLDEAPWDAVVCDLMMPDVSGMDLYRQATARHPDLEGRFAFITGGAFTDEARAFVASVAAPVIEKPFEVGRVRAAVDALLERLPPGAQEAGPETPRA